MKKPIQFLFIVCLLSSLQTKAQQYQPMPTAGAVWCGDRGFIYSALQGYEYHTYTYQQFIIGDTIINNVPYHKLYESGLFNWFTIPIGPGGSSGSSYYYKQYKGCFRELNKKIWFMESNLSAEVLLYDFNLNVGDALPFTYVNSPAMLKITSIDSVLMGAVFHKKYNISTIDTLQWPTNFEYASITEGVSSTHGLTWILEPYFENHGSLFSFKRNGMVLYPDTVTSCEITGIKNFENTNKGVYIFPNPASKNITVKLNDARDLNSKILIYNLVGNVVFEKLATMQVESIDVSTLVKGIYLIRFGKETEKLVIN